VHFDVLKADLKVCLLYSKLTESWMAAGMLIQTTGAEAAEECRGKSDEMCGRRSTIVLPECNVINGGRY